MPTFFISDLHLDESRPEMTQLFLHFLQHEAKEADALYILGDLFEIWIGDDAQTALHRTVAKALRALPCVYFMHGNRDFLIGKRFAQEAGYQILPDPVVVTPYHQTILLTHGDLLCTEDTSYLRYRTWARNFFCQKLFLGLPLPWRQVIAKRLRQASQQHTQISRSEIMDITEEAVSTIMDKYQVTRLIHGHTHRPMIRFFVRGGGFVQHIVLSDWEIYGNMLVLYPEGNVRLVNFRTL
ncbi:MAG: UDP-2,3-diacylglucosamine diphosphatase [Gammaproteobacteria bacterium]